MRSSEMTTPRQREWMKFVRDSAKTPPIILGVDLALDVVETWDIIYSDNYRPMLIHGTAAVVQSVLLALKVVPGSWWIDPFGSEFTMRLGGPLDSQQIMDDCLEILRKEKRITPGSESVRLVETANRHSIQMDFVPKGLASAFTLYAPVRRH